MGSYRYRSLIEGLLVEAPHFLNSPPVVSFNMGDLCTLEATRNPNAHDLTRQTLA